MIKRLVTIHAVCVDSVIDTEWESNKGGVRDIRYHDHGIYIHFNFGTTFVPYGNVAYAQER